MSQEIIGLPALLTGSPEQMAAPAHANREAHPDFKAFTIQGCQMGLALMKGYKPIETRSCRWRPGWYWLHVGKGGLRCVPGGEKALRQCWPPDQVLPDETVLPQSCIIGRVRLGRVIPASRVSHAWVIDVACGKSRPAGSAGPPSAAGAVVPKALWCHVIEEAEEFMHPVRNIKGCLNIWKVKDPEVRQRLKQALLSSTSRSFWPSFPAIGMDGLEEDCAI